MNFTGTSLLYLPGINIFNFIFEDVVINSTGLYNINFYTQNAKFSLTLTSGLIIGFDTTGHISNYNIGQAFTISGCKTYWTDNVTDRWYLKINNGLLDYHYTGHDLLSGLQLVMQPGASMSCDFELYANPVNYNVSIPPTFAADSTFTGYIESDTSTWIYGNGLQFYNSWDQTILTGLQTIMYLPANQPQSITFVDNDDNQTASLLEGYLTLYTTQGNLPFTFYSLRTGIFQNNYTDFYRIGSGNTISGLFNGIWSGEQFIFQDIPQNLTLNYYFMSLNGMGVKQSVPLMLQFQQNYPLPNNPQRRPLYPNIYQSDYITGFILTNSGAYTAVPSTFFSSYYMVTGLQQPLRSMLFSSGCTGNLTINFSGQGGTGASGQLSLFPITFSGVYTSGIGNFYLVSSYSSVNAGSGYTGNPIASIVTGEYSSGGDLCYDVPSYYNENIAWFTPFNTVGALSPQSAYLTGEVLYQTGIVTGNGYTGAGYNVTGLFVSNIGNGYNGTYYPLVSFIRQTGDILTNNASGYFNISSTGSLVFANAWTFQYSIDGYPYQNVPITNISGTAFITLQPINSTLNVLFAYSGVPNTEPISVLFTLTHPTGQWIELITGTKYYNNSTGFFFEPINYNLSGTYAPGTDLSFTFTQNELDNYYSSSAFINNPFPFSLGDFDF